MTSPISSGRAAPLPQAVIQKKTEEQEAKQKVSDDPAAQTSASDGADDNEGIVVTAQKILDSLDEMSALAWVRFRRLTEKRDEIISDSALDYILDEESPQKLQNLIGVLRNEKVLSVKQLLEYARTLFADPSDLYAALRGLLRNSTLSKSELKLLEESLETLEDEDNEKVRSMRAGLNIALKARIFGKKMDTSPGRLRDTYRKFLRGEGTALDNYEDWVADYGARKRVIITDFMENALVTDIDANDPSCSLSEFGYLRGHLTQIKNIRSSDFIFIQKIKRNKLLISFNNSEDEWLYFFFCILRNPESLFTSLKETGGVAFTAASPTKKVEFIQTLYRYCRLCPIEIFTDNDSREELMTYFLEILSEGRNRENSSSH